MEIEPFPTQITHGAKEEQLRQSALHRLYRQFCWLQNGAKEGRVENRLLTVIWWELLRSADSQYIVVWWMPTTERCKRGKITPEATVAAVDDATSVRLVRFASSIFARCVAHYSSAQTTAVVAFPRTLYTAASIPARRSPHDTPQRAITPLGHLTADESREFLANRHGRYVASVKTNQLHRRPIYHHFVYRAWPLCQLCLCFDQHCVLQA